VLRVLFVVPISFFFSGSCAHISISCIMAVRMIRTKKKNLAVIRNFFPGIPSDRMDPGSSRNERNHSDIMEEISMKKILAVILAMSLLLSFCVCGASAEEDRVESAGETESRAAVPPFMTPSVFVPRFNALMNTLADYDADVLGEENVNMIRQDYTITLVDPQGAMVYYGNNDWSIESSFLYADQNSAGDDAPAVCLNFTIKNGVPEFAADMAKYALKMIIYYYFQDDISLDELTEWFNTADDPVRVFLLPGYTLSVFPMEEYTLYAILPPAESNPYVNR